MQMSTRTATWRIIIGIALFLPLLGLTSAAFADGTITAGGVNLKIWGKAKLDMQYDTGQQAVDFMSYLKDDDTESFTFNPRDTRFGFKASSTEGRWTYSGVFEIDFYGTNAGNSLIPRMRLGYAEAKKDNGLSFRGGQDWIPVAQQNPGTLDFGVQSWSGNLWWRVPQFTVRYKPKNVELLASVMKHRVSTAQEQMETMPWFLARIGFSDLMGKGSLLAIGGGVRSASDVTLPTAGGGTDTSDYNSSLVAFELKVPMGEKFVLVGEAYTGKGIGREYVHYGFDYNPSHMDGGEAVQSQGGFVNLKFAASPKVTLNGGFGLDDPKDEDMYYEYDVVGPPAATVTGYSGPYLKNQSIYVNMKYAVTKNFGWGLEYIDFKTTMAMDDLTGQRYTGSWWYSF